VWQLLDRSNDPIWVTVNARTAPGTIIENVATLKDDAIGGTASATTEVKAPPPPKGHREPTQ
jgi:hypothetical protein